MQSKVIAVHSGHTVKCQAPSFHSSAHEVSVYSFLANCWAHGRNIVVIVHFLCSAMSSLATVSLAGPPTLPSCIFTAHWSVLSSEQLSNTGRVIIYPALLEIDQVLKRCCSSTTQGHSTTLFSPSYERTKSPFYLNNIFCVYISFKCPGELNWLVCQARFPRMGQMNERITDIYYIVLNFVRVTQILPCGCFVCLFQPGMCEMWMLFNTTTIFIPTNCYLD